MKLGKAQTAPGVGRQVLARIESVFSRFFEGPYNPFHHLGALTIFFFYVALVTGIYLFIFYRATLEGAWESVEHLTHEQWWAGGIMRSLHRYASNAAVITLLLHIVRELLRGRYKGPRWFSWLTGVPLIWIVIWFGISGYWMVWDELAQYVALGSARLLDWLPIFTDPMSRNFISQEAVSSRLFTLIAFIHLVGLPIIIVLAIWFHLLRIKRPNINPPRKLMLGSMGALLVLSVIVPVHSHAPANLDRVPLALNIDWFYLALFPLQSVTSESITWAIAGGGTLLLAVLPWLPPARPVPTAEVYLPDCTGCGFCAEDCPYGAIDMVPRTDARRFELEAKVNPALCVSCGICVGACPSSSPVRQRRPLTTGIDLPHYPIEEFRKALEAGSDSARDSVLIFGCDHGAQIERLTASGLHTVGVPCVGMVPPAGIGYALRETGYRGVVIAGCEGYDCHHRLGDEFTRQRIDRQRQPGLRRHVPRARLLTTWFKPGDESRLESRIVQFKAGLDAPDTAGRPERKRRRFRDASEVSS